MCAHGQEPARVPRAGAAGVPSPAGPSPAGLGLLALPALSTGPFIHSFDKYLLAIYYPCAGMRRMNEKIPSLRTGPLTFSPTAAPHSVLAWFPQANTAPHFCASVSAPVATSSLESQ